MRRKVLLVGFLAAATSGACDGMGGVTAGEAIPEMIPDQLLVGLRVDITVDGVREATVVADSAYMFEDSTAMRLFGLDMRVFTTTGAERAHVTSETGQLDRHTQAMVATGNAVVVAEGGARTIRTEELHYDPAADRVWSDVPFVMDESGRTTRGTGFSSDAQFRNVRVDDISSDRVQIEF